MKIIIIGAGEVGSNLAEKLSLEKLDVVIIDTDQEKLNPLTENLDVQAICGSGTVPSVLHDAGIEQADMIAAVTNSDETNILACKISHMLAPKSKRIARIKDADYYTTIDQNYFKDSFAIDHIISPDYEIVKNILDFLKVPWACDVIEVANGLMLLVGIRLPAGHALVGKTLGESFSRDKNHHLLIAVIYRDTTLVVPKGDTVLQAGDLIYIASDMNYAKDISDFFGMSNRPVKNIIIVGGGDVGYQLALALEKKQGLNIKLVESNAKRGVYLSGLLNKTMVIKGDGTDQTLLLEENIDDCDAFIALTADDEKNMVSSLLAKKLGAATTITRVNRFAYVQIVSAIGLESLVSLRVSAVSAILKYIRKGRILSVSTLKNEDVEIIESVVSEKSKIAGMSLSKAPLPKGAIVAALTRNGQMLIPTGKTLIEAGDILVLVSKEESIEKLEKLIAPK